jgi:phage baseplate assembly protein W
MSGPVLTGGTSTLPRIDVGWPLLPVPDADGMIGWPDAATSVRQMIEVILRTTPGEQLMRPSFGAGTEALLHLPNTLTTRARAHEAITAALDDYEPRILVDAVSVDEGSDGRELVVTIAYRLTLTNQPAVITALIPVGAG